MSLIPSESYSFPDHFTSTIVPSRRPKKASPELVLEKARKKPAIVALPDPEPEAVILSQNGNGEMEIEALEVPVAPVPAAPPNPALRRAYAPPPRIPETPPVKKISLPPTLKPKVRWNNRAPAMDPARAHNNGNGNRAGEVLAPAQEVIPMKPAKLARPLQPAPPPAMMRAPVQRGTRPAQAPAAPQPKPKTPAPVVSNPQTDFFEMFAESGQATAARRRRQMKFRRFIACETAALLVLLSLVVLGVTLNITAPGLRWILNIFTIAAAVTVALIPIVFYAVAPTLPDLER